MTTQQTLLELLQQIGLTPLDWVDAAQFAALTGIAEQKLPARKRKWPENVVWMKEGGNIYYSMKGYNQWMTKQANTRCRVALESDREVCKSTSNGGKDTMQSRCHSQSVQRVSAKHRKLEVI